MELVLPVKIVINLSQKVWLIKLRIIGGSMKKKNFSIYKITEALWVDAEVNDRIYLQVCDKGADLDKMTQIIEANWSIGELLRTLKRLKIPYKEIKEDYRFLIYRDRGMTPERR